MVLNVTLVKTEFLSWSILRTTQGEGGRGGHAEIQYSEHAAGSGKQSSTGVSITTSYVTGATHTRARAHSLAVLGGNQLYIHEYTDSHSVSPTLMSSSCFPP